MLILIMIMINVDEYQFGHKLAGNQTNILIYAFYLIFIRNTYLL